MVVDELARRRDASFKAKFNGRLGETRVDDHRIALLKPETFMNESGRSISAAARFYKVPVESVVVVHDDVDLRSRSAASACAAAGSRGTTDCVRSRRLSEVPTSSASGSAWGGPGRGDHRDVADFVLSPFEPHEDRDGVVGRAADAVELLVRDGLDETQRRFN